MAFLSALFSELDTDLEAEAARHFLLWELFWPPKILASHSHLLL